ncbi:adenine phosphoribosyltransferase [Phytophthora nicotianae P10297]|uniref:adenine phosphoribosyltransferase n=2 Tax=Phytophthora nicotianae TaxID=4792 RepID=W2ZF19_PHYNI|nr:adenine phosphoribosyltransferase [Phytophthora nicotianae]ETP45675.1 adenine phosphoribosyltransferase [Phytophthora nicotianae P10297]
MSCEKLAMRSPPADLTNEEEVSAYIKEKIRVYSNFPKPGADFSDVTSLLLDPIAFQVAIDALKLRYEDKGITHVVSTESRGFIFGAPLALALEAAFVPVRRTRRLPGDVVGVDYVSGYYSGRMEVHQDAIPNGGRVVIIDDLVASGKTLRVTVELVEKLGGEVVECGCVINSLHSTDSLENIPLYGLTMI